MAVMQFFPGRIEWITPNSKSIAARPHGPSQILSNGDVRFIQEPGSYWYNRKRGPAIIYANGKIIYVPKESVYHRTDGPAIIFADGTVEYWVEDTQVTPEKFFVMYGVL